MSKSRVEKTHIIAMVNNISFDEAFDLIRKEASHRKCTFMGVLDEYYDRAMRGEPIE